jgi:hypothetical protein
MLPSRTHSGAIDNSAGTMPMSGSLQLTSANGAFPSSCYNSTRTPFAIQEILGLNVAAAVGMPGRQNGSADNIDNVMQPAYFMSGAHSQSYTPACFLDQSTNGNAAATMATMSGMFPLEMNSASFMSHIPTTFEYANTSGANCDSRCILVAIINSRISVNADHLPFNLFRENTEKSGREKRSDEAKERGARSPDDLTTLSSSNGVSHSKRKKRRHRTIFTQYQVEELEKAFKEAHYPGNGFGDFLRKLAWLTIKIKPILFFVSAII